MLQPTHDTEHKCCLSFHLFKIIKQFKKKKQHTHFCLQPFSPFLSSMFFPIRGSHSFWRTLLKGKCKILAFTIGNIFTPSLHPTSLRASPKHTPERALPFHVCTKVSRIASQVLRKWKVAKSLHYWGFNSTVMQSTVLYMRCVVFKPCWTFRGKIFSFYLARSL